MHSNDNNKRINNDQVVVLLISNNFIRIYIIIIKILYI